MYNNTIIPCLCLCASAPLAREGCHNCEFLKRWDLVFGDDGSSICLRSGQCIKELHIRGSKKIFSPLCGDFYLYSTRAKQCVCVCVCVHALGLCIFLQLLTCAQDVVSQEV
ncbi:hypothetical protein TRVL_03042 [Trypanosoma vivax]|nr:hypothetical protein TRVL_03042 [Trypanosoma vivax]